MSDFIDNTYKRVELIIKSNGMNIKSFEEKIDVSNNSIGTAIRRKASFKSNVLNKILNAFPEINPTWLLTGKGKMLVGENTYANEPSISYNDIDLEIVKSQLIHLLKEDQEVKKAISTVTKD